MEERKLLEHCVIEEVVCGAAPPPKVYAHSNTDYILYSDNNCTLNRRSETSLWAIIKDIEKLGQSSETYSGISRPNPVK